MRERSHGRQTFRAMSPQVDLPALDRDVLDRWSEAKVFERSLERNAGGEPWVFYEGPPTANGKPGAHHVEARAFKDLFPRFQTMKGRYVPRRGGWDCHGLPVELAVEKELGFSGKQDIEAYGVAAFNEKCRESVRRYVAEWEQMSRRMGYWADYDGAYWTMSPDYVDSVWWSLEKVFDAGLLVQDHRVTPYCPRCGTGLSDHEVAQGYLTVSDPSVYVRFPVESGPLAERGAALLVWTTTPWTLISNTAVVVNPDVTYAVVRARDETLVVAEPLLRAVFGERPYEVVETMPGSALERTEYRRPFEFVEFPAGVPTHYVGLADYVTTDDGTGLVHQAPAFGADDLAVARRYGLPVVNPVRPDGRFDEELPLVGGLFFKSADAVIVGDLDARRLLFRQARYEHSYPHCWRCDTPLLYYALPSWFIRTTAVKDRLLAENARTDWHPQSIRDGRYGDWLENNVDWALSRNRYWGTPLPIWRCAEGHLTAVGSRTELGRLAGRDLTDLDPHRPYVDDVTFGCPHDGCGRAATRVPEVIDAWYDSGSMPFAQHGYPHHGVAEFERSYPADFIAEAIDQTRGWFYTLMAVGTLVFDRSSYRTVLCLGHILDEQGRKMSKHLGNVLDPFELFERHGADAVRWLMLCGGNPWSARRVGHELLEEIVRKVLLTYWNTAAFLVLYARASDWAPGDPAPRLADRPLLDRWAISELHRTVVEVTEALESYDSVGAGRRIADFVDDLSNWYVRRSRRRFWAGEAAALATLHECLEVLTRLMAPIVPFVTEEVHRRLVVDVWDDVADSVHLRDWPVVDGALVDRELSDQMAFARRVVEVGRQARAQSGMKTRQPLARALVIAAGWDAVPPELREQVAEELNVQVVEHEGGGEGGEVAVEVTVKPNFRLLGKRFGARTKAVAAAVTAAAPEALLADPVVTADGERIRLEPGELVVTSVPREGWAVASEPGLTVALDTQLTPDLRRAGLAREVVRLVQEARKSTGLDVTDRIELWWSAEDAELATALREGGQAVAAEVLAVSVTEGSPRARLREHVDADLGLTFWLRAAGR
jgi:isoleucyl-tRNA synthetase